MRQKMFSVGVGDWMSTWEDARMERNATSNGRLVASWKNDHSDELESDSRVVHGCVQKKPLP